MEPEDTNGINVPLIAGAIAGGIVFLSMVILISILINRYIFKVKIGHQSFNAVLKMEITSNQSFSNGVLEIGH